VPEVLHPQYGPALRVITHLENRGYGGTLRSGFAAAKMEFVFCTEGDASMTRRAARLLELAGASTGLVNGYKLERNDPRHCIWMGNVYNFYARLCFASTFAISIAITADRRSLVESIHLDSGTICVELVRKLALIGCEVAEVGVNHYPRLYGRSQLFSGAVARSDRQAASAAVSKAGGFEIEMTKFPMVNLRPMLTATEAAWRRNLDRLFESLQLVLSEHAAAFERELAAALGAKYAVGVGSGTAAIDLSIRAAPKSPCRDLAVHRPGRGGSGMPAAARRCRSRHAAAGCRRRPARRDRLRTLLAGNMASRLACTNPPLHLQPPFPRLVRSAAICPWRSVPAARSCHCRYGPAIAESMVEEVAARGRVLRLRQLDLDVARS
jgi:hypothetical protein